jgi:molecular chaperone DnaJ
MMASTKRDYYEVLEVERGADGDTITKAYRRLAMKYHPDRNAGDKDAEDKFKEAAEAYDVLRDADKRARYDRYGHAGLEGFNGAPHFNDARSVFDVFGDLFGDLFGGGRGGRGGPQPGRDLQYHLEIDLVEAAKGVRKSFTIPREELCPDCGGTGAKKGSRPSPCRRCDGQGVVIQRQGFFSVQRACPGCGGRGEVITDPCPGCHGDGRVTVRRTLDVMIPPGVDSGVRVRVPGEGEPGDYGAPRGDLFVVVKVREHPLFHREGNHLVCQVPVTFSQAALGAAIDVPTLDGRMAYDLPRGVQSGEVLRIGGQGMPSIRGGRRGDLLVQVLVETPRNLTKRQEELFRELAEIEHKHVSPARKGFLEKLKEFFSPGEAESPPG